MSRLDGPDTRRKKPAGRGVRGGAGRPRRLRAEGMKETLGLIREWWRQLRLPECTHCGSADISRSSPRPWDKPLSWLSLLPHRCASCGRRFYLLRRGGP